MQENIEKVNRYDNFKFSLQELKEATGLTKADKTLKLINQVDCLSLTEEGISFLYDHVLEIENAGVFYETPWSEPNKLSPNLVSGTIKSGHPNSTYELLSELRMLAYAKEVSTDKDCISSEEAMSYMEEVMVNNLEFVFREVTEETRLSMTVNELTKAFNLFAFLLEKCRLEGIKEKLSEEITLICEQRPVVTRRAKEIIKLVKYKVRLEPNLPSDQVLQKYIDALFTPSAGGKKHTDPKEYQSFLKKATNKILKSEAVEMGNAMRETGLVSNHHAYLITHLIQKDMDECVPAALGLNPTGEAEWHRHQNSVKKLIKEVIHPFNNQFLYGLSKMLEEGLFSREAVHAGLDNIRRIRIHPNMERKILKSIVYPQPDITALQYLRGALIRILGQPFGVGQGNNPTCQSARGISMWSQHDPAKLINLVIAAATQDNLIFRFEGQELESNLVGKGLLERLDYNLDAVSIVLVPKLDKIYNEMMIRASGRGEDPHKWVNPALYGHWIQVGFASAYDYTYVAIRDYQGFMKVFYATCHPSYNGARKIVFPNPIGIFITSSKGVMLGFHAVSLLRVAKDPQGIVRAYFLNPNNEGRQNWGQNIMPSVHGQGEKRGESSLPFYQFAARVYAFHYNTQEVKSGLEKVAQEELIKVEKIARESWGKAYAWVDIKKEW
ncbi:MAG: hypothetical protein M3Q58_10640 [Bacteroidota bacterium]|nr:hypothetical protein [Bacteroidota bacterium]